MTDGAPLAEQTCMPINGACANRDVHAADSLGEAGAPLGALAALALGVGKRRRNKYPRALMSMWSLRSPYGTCTSAIPSR